MPKWANKLDHYKIDIIEDGKVGPWLHLYAPFNQECNGRDPCDFLWVPEDNAKEKLHAPHYEIYTGPLPDSDEYKEAAKAFDGCLEE